MNALTIRVNQTRNYFRRYKYGANHRYKRTIRDTIEEILAVGQLAGILVVGLGLEWTLIPPAMTKLSSLLGI